MSFRFCCPGFESLSIVDGVCTLSDWFLLLCWSLVGVTFGCSTSLECVSFSFCCTVFESLSMTDTFHEFYDSFYAALLFV